MKTMTTCPLLETGLADSRYMVKLSSLQRISGCFGALVEGDPGEPTAAAVAAETMLHMGQPGLGAKAMAGALVLRGAEGDGDSKEDTGREGGGSRTWWLSGGEREEVTTEAIRASGWTGLTLSLTLSLTLIRRVQVRSIVRPGLAVAHD